jgi:hypothetical protein
LKAGLVDDLGGGKTAGVGIRNLVAAVADTVPIGEEPTSSSLSAAGRSASSRGLMLVMLAWRSSSSDICVGRSLSGEGDEDIAKTSSVAVSVV